MAWAYDATGCSSSTGTTGRAARSYEYDAPYYPGRKAMPGSASNSPSQPLIEPGLEKREYGYLAFGGTYSPTTTVSLTQRYTYTGRERNPTSALMYYRYRQYDPRVGRFGGRDPLTATAGILARLPEPTSAEERALLPSESDNDARPALYGYVGNASISHVDPFGLEEVHEWYLAGFYGIGRASPGIQTTLWLADMQSQGIVEHKIFRWGFGGAAVEWLVEKLECKNGKSNPCKHALLAGYSWGGKTALIVASRIKEKCGKKVDGVALIDCVNRAAFTPGGIPYFPADAIKKCGNWYQQETQFRGHSFPSCNPNANVGPELVSARERIYYDSPNWNGSRWAHVVIDEFVMNRAARWLAAVPGK